MSPEFKISEACNTELVRISPVNVDGKAIVTVNVKAIEDLKADCAAKDERIADLETKLHDAIWALKGVVPSGGVSVVIDELQTVIKEGEAG